MQIATSVTFNVARLYLSDRTLSFPAYPVEYNGYLDRHMIVHVPLIACFHFVCICLPKLSVSIEPSAQGSGVCDEIR